MVPSLGDIEKEYDRTVQEVAREFHIVGDTTTAELLHKLEAATADRMHPAPVWILSGISGSGKSTIVRLLHEYGYRRVPNVVTRARRPGESQDDNRFVDDATFLTWEHDGALFHPHMTNGVRHAMLISDIERLLEGPERFYLDKSVPSVRELLAAYPRLRTASLIYVLAPSFQVLYDRIKKREQIERSLSHDEIMLRFVEEIHQLKETVHAPYAFIVNDSIDRVQQRIRSVMQK